MSYGDYLHLDQVLSAQQPLSGKHDELLSSPSIRCRSSG
jgi:tryptophan 2,3-dioxygenase